MPTYPIAPHDLTVVFVTPEGFPIAYEVLPGNTTDKATLADFLRKIETQYGKADRPIHHQHESRIQAHIFISFLA